MRRAARGHAGDARRRQHPHRLGRGDAGGLGLELEPTSSGANPNPSPNANPNHAATQAVLDAGFLRALPALLSSPKMQLRKEVLLLALTLLGALG